MMDDGKTTLKEKKKRVLPGKTVTVSNMSATIPTPLRLAGFRIF